jgi:hypothetical protein
MKYILIIIFLLSGIYSQAQLSTNQNKQVTGMIKTETDKLYTEIKWLKSGKTADSLSIIFLTNLNNQLANTISKLIEFQTQQTKLNISTVDSFSVLRAIASKELNLYIDTKSLGFKQDTLYNPQFYKK